MSSVTARPVSRSKSRSLYISCPIRVSQHYREEGRGEDGLRTQAESLVNKRMRYFLLGLQFGARYAYPSPQATVF